LGLAPVERQRRTNVRCTLGLAPVERQRRTNATAHFRARSWRCFFFCLK
jgi:hypothetical protein